MEVKCRNCGEEDYGGVIELIYNGWRTFYEQCVCPKCAIEGDTDNDIISTYTLTKMKFDIDGD